MEPPSRPETPRKVVILIYPGVQILDVAGPLQVFTSAGTLPSTLLPGPPPYITETIGIAAGPTETSAGLPVVAARSFRDIGATEAIDTLLVAGGNGVFQTRRDPEVAQWLLAMRPRVRRLGSVCTGAFLLAEAGLLRGRRAVTHWAHCQRLSEEHPDIRVESDALFLMDGGIHTSAGVTAGMDLALALVEEDLGHAIALAVARHLVLFLKRPGGQSQFSAHLMAPAVDGSPIGRVRHWILEHPDADLSVTELAARAAMSPRNFARVFQRETGMTPGRFVERARIDAARRRLETSRDTIDRIAETCGFGCGETMRRSFVRHLGISPNDYRQRFQTAPPCRPPLHHLPCRPDQAAGLPQ